jgi:hypothetical protein
MPRKNMGLSYELTRYHRIGSPNDPARVERDRPLECALCHADRSVDQIVSTMERWWKKRFDRGALRGLYGADLRIDAIRATLMAGLPHERATAASVAAEHGRTDLLPLVLDVMKNEYPLVRYYGKHAALRLGANVESADPGAASARQSNVTERHPVTPCDEWRAEDPHSTAECASSFALGAGKTR